MENVLLPCSSIWDGYKLVCREVGTSEGISTTLKQILSVGYTAFFFRALEVF